MLKALILALLLLSGCATFQDAIETCGYWTTKTPSLCVEHNKSVCGCKQKTFENNKNKDMIE